MHARYQSITAFSGKLNLYADKLQEDISEKKLAFHFRENYHSRNYDCCNLVRDESRPRTLLYVFTRIVFKSVLKVLE